MEQMMMGAPPIRKDVGIISYDEKRKCFIAVINGGTPEIIDEKELVQKAKDAFKDEKDKDSEE